VGQEVLRIGSNSKSPVGRNGSPHGKQRLRSNIAGTTQVVFEVTRSEMAGIGFPHQRSPYQTRQQAASTIRDYNIAR
jgi:hypothetical protein